MKRERNTVRTAWLVMTMVLELESVCGNRPAQAASGAPSEDDKFIYSEDVSLRCKTNKVIMFNKSGRILRVLVANVSGGSVSLAAGNTVSNKTCLELGDAKLTDQGEFVVFSLDAPCKVVATTSTRPVKLSIKVYQGPEILVETK